MTEYNEELEARLTALEGTHAGREESHHNTVFGWSRGSPSHERARSQAGRQEEEKEGYR